MKKIRIGNDIVIKWRITVNGEEVNLEGLDLSLYISTTYQPRKAIAFTVAGNEITATYKGSEQKVTGVYRLTLYRNEGENAQSILDACDAFELVRCSCLTVDSAFGATEVELPLADLGVGIPGLSAYEIAVAEGFEGTQEEWLASLSAASEAAAAECRKVIAEFSHAEDSRVAAEAQRVVNENNRIAGEESRAEAEANRVAAEQLRVAAESQRVTNETARSNAESSRATAETARQEAETARQEAEQGRVTAEQHRVDAEAARVEAEAARAEEFAGFADTLAAKEDVANKVTSINADADDVHYPSAKAVKDTVDVVDTKIKYLGVTVNEGVNKLIPELYLTGLDESKTYEIYSIGKGSTSRYVHIYDVNGDDVDIPVATAYTNDLTTDVLRVEEVNGLGISGWIVCNWEAVPDGTTNYFAKVRTEAVVNLSNSPRIALTIEIDRNKAKLDEAIAETEAKADNIENKADYIGNRLDRLETGKYYQEISLDSIGIRREGYYINKFSGAQLTASVGVISNAIFLNPGDSIVAFTGGTGMAVIARSETEPDDSTVYIPEAIADNLTEPVNYIVEVAGYYSFCGRNATEGELALSVNVKKHTETEGIIPAMQEAIDGLYGPITEVEYSLSDLRGDGELVDYYLNNAQLRILAATDAIVTKPIYLHAGDKVECSTGGTGLLLFAKSPSGIIDRTTLGFVSISGTATSYSGVISEDAWYVFSGRINRTDGTNLVVKINAYTKEKSVFELLNEKVSKSDLSFSLEDVAEQSSGFALSIGADSVKDVIPTVPWFNLVDNDGTMYGTYLDDKIDSIPQGNSFIFISDVHYAGNKGNSGKLIDYVRRRLGIKTIIHGGDVLNESPTIAQAAKEWLNFNRDFVFRIGCDFKQVCGDHDHNGRYASEGQALSYQFIQRVINGYNIKELKFDTLYDKQVEEIATSNGWTDYERKEYDAWKKIHYYFDDTTIRTRFVILHTGWTGEAGLAVDKLGAGVVSETNALYLQMDFLYESLITCPANYNVVVVGHNVIGNKSYTVDLGDGSTAARYNVNEIVWKGAWLQVAKMVDAFKGKNSIVLSYRDWSGQGLLSKQFDFSIAKTPGIVFCMGGDVHWDILGKFSPDSNTLSPVAEATLADIIPAKGYVSKSDILHALTMTDGGDRGYKVIVAAPDDNYDDALDSTLASASNTAGTLDSQAFDVVTITEKAIYFTRIGSGNDRVVYISD